jgi:hypothetical protein
MSKPSKYHIYHYLWIAAIGLLLGFNALGVCALVLQSPTPHILPPPKQYLAQVCQEQGCDFALLYAIVECESGWRMVKNTQSSAFGFFQIIDGTETTTPQYAQGQRKYDPYVNIDMGVYLYQQRGTNPWLSSRACWQRKYSQVQAFTGQHRDTLKD